jgi:CIC family chloride channel protein
LLASVAFAFEATHAGAAFGPLLLGCAAAVLVSRLLMKESIMTESLSRKGLRVPDHYLPDALAHRRAGEVMLRDPVVLPPEMKVGHLAEKISDPSSPWSHIRLFPIAGPGGELCGVISRADVFAAIVHNPEVTVMDAGISTPVTIRDTQSLAEATEIMLRHEIGRLPVVSGQSRRLVGLLSRREILSSRRGLIDHDPSRE